jgi:hypothetical protein
VPAGQSSTLRPLDLSWPTATVIGSSKVPAPPAVEWIWPCEICGLPAGVLSCQVYPVM